MDRLREGSSRLTRFFLWLIVVTLFSDAANLDDLFFSSPVIHDDEEIVSASPNISCDSSNPLHLVKEMLGVQPARMHIIVDQDSPSLPADDSSVERCCLTLFADEPPLPSEFQPPKQELHILFRSLLI